MGEQKARRLAEAFQQPFRSESALVQPPATQPPAEAQAQTKAQAQEPAHADTPDEAGSPGELALPDDFESLPEEEQLRIALELSVDK